jgi:hypothetical protein
MGIIVEPHPSWFPHAVGLAPNEELVEMFIHPAEHDLQGVVKLSYGAIAAYEQATPDLRTDSTYPDAQLINLNCCICWFTHSSSSSARSIFLHTLHLFLAFA